MPQLDLVDLDQPREGYRQFVSCWVSRTPERVSVVDPGPAGTVPDLLRALEALGVDRVDLVLLTHVHLDHAGGTARLLDAFPGARVYCPPRGRRHLVDPARLWQGSVAVLGEVASMYGEPDPVPAQVLVDEDHLAARGVRVVPAPGHASHHACFVQDDVLFAGEVFGTTLAHPTGRPYLRPATPPRFALEPFLGSLDRVGGLDPSLRVAFAHHGLSADPACWAHRARTQLLAWVDRARRLAREHPGEVHPRFEAEVLATDPLCGGTLHAGLPADLRAREVHFLHNSLDGLLDWMGRP